MPFFLGFDAGGTSTKCILASEDRVLARAKGGSIKIIRVTPEEAEATLRRLVDEVTRQAGVGPDRIAVSCVGSAGATTVPVVAPWTRKTLGALVSGEILICGDDEIALDAAFPGRSGALIIAGTGSNCVARTSTGVSVNAGGWGPMLGDEGSGYWIGHQALRAAFRAWDAGQPGLLLDRVREQWQVPDLRGIVGRAHAIPAPDFAGLAPLVSACAEEGDRLCQSILAEAGRRLARLVVLAYRRMRARETNLSTPAGIAFTGSVLGSIASVRRSMIEGIHRELPGVAIAPEAVEPVLGALWRARNAPIRTR